jgi:hypothetical protein
MKYVPVAFLAVSLLAPGTSLAQAQEWFCPPVEKVGLRANSPDWTSYDTLMYPYQAPVLRLESMENNTHGPAAVCKYRVENSGLMTIWKVGKCENGKGTWKSQGPKSTCESRNPSDCSLVCSPVSAPAKLGG